MSYNKGKWRDVEYDPTRYYQQDREELLKICQPDLSNNIDKKSKDKFKNRLYLILVGARDEILRTRKEDSIDSSRQNWYRSGVGVLLYSIED